MVWVAALLLAALLAPGAPAKKSRKPRPPDLEILESSGHRVEGRIALDGRVRNTGEKPLYEVILVFDFLAPGGGVVTTQKASIDEELLEPGHDALFRVQLNDPVRAVKFQLGATDKSGRDLRVARAGPFTIE